MVHGRHLLALSALLLFAVGCSTAALKSPEIRFELAETPVHVKESGAIIVNKRQVARLLEDGKVVDSMGRPVAWVREDSIRLKGGITIPIYRDREGTLSLSKAAQEKAGLKPVVHRVRKNGTMASTEKSRGTPVGGAHIEKNRRVILFLLVMSTNNRW